MEEGPPVKKWIVTYKYAVSLPYDPGEWEDLQAAYESACKEFGIPLSPEDYEPAKMRGNILEWLVSEHYAGNAEEVEVIDVQFQRVYPCCPHCNHSAPWGGSETVVAGGDAHTEPCGQGCVVA
jgi:hypothetical protein